MLWLTASRMGRSRPDVYTYIYIYIERETDRQSEVLVEWETGGNPHTSQPPTVAAEKSASGPSENTTDGIFLILQ